MKAFVESQFAYSPLVSIFHSRILNNKINLLHHSALKFVYLSRRMIDFSRTPEKFTIFSVITVLGNIWECTFFNEIFTTDIPENFTCFLGPKLWNIIPLDDKNSASLAIFKQKVKSWTPVN